MALRRLAPIGRRIVAGQPIPATHPELLAAGELSPGIAAVEFEARRNALVNLMPPGALAIIPSAPQAYMAGMIPYPYRQDADFRYLTGIIQQALALISRSGFTVFVPNHDPQVERWDGERLNCDAAVDVFGADEAYPMSEMPRRLADAVREATRIWYDAERWHGTDTSVAMHSDLVGLGLAREHGRVKPLRTALHSLRWIKSPAELDLMRRSAQMAAYGIAKCISHSSPGVAEHRLSATFESECKMAGAQRMAYPPVVAGGEDACTIHYSRNDKVVRGGEVLLMDAGCELHGYASDVTRTWPVSGRFTGPQKAVYEVVLETHRQCIEACRPGATLRQIHGLSIRLLSEGMQQLGLFPDMSMDAISNSAYRMLYPHSIGHWLGLDTHDTSGIGHACPLQPGVVMTIEPGLYIPPDPRFGAFAGIGVRIEDDVAVTDGAPDVLSSVVPVDPDEVERLVSSGL